MVEGNTGATADDLRRLLVEDLLWVQATNSVDIHAEYLNASWSFIYKVAYTARVLRKAFVYLL